MRTVLRSVFTKIVHDQWRVLLAWTGLSGIVAGFYLSLYPSIGAIDEMRRLLESMPPAVRAMFAAEGADISTPAGYLNVEMFTFVVPLLVFAMTLTAGGGATAGEEERGTLELLLANPVPRWRVVVEKFAGMAFLGAVVAAGVWLALALTASAASIELALDKVAAALVSAWLLGLAVGSIALALGALTGNRAFSIGVALGVAVLGFFLNALGPLVDALKPWRVLSPHYHYLGYDPLANGLDASHALVLAGMTFVLLILAVVAFERRNLNA
jgi:beta-exotoxin I transport system permease protein